MPVYALEIDDFCEEEYSLIGIHSTLEDYKLAYLLNKNLSTKFYKAKEDLEFVREKTKVSFSIYNYENNEKFEDKKTVNVPYTMKLLIQELESMAIATRLITEENVNSQVFNTMKKDISKYSIDNDISDDIDEGEEEED